MSNQLLTSQVITYETLSVLKNDLRIVKNFWRDGDKEFGKKGGKISLLAKQRNQKALQQKLVRKKQRKSCHLQKKVQKKKCCKH